MTGFDARKIEKSSLSKQIFKELKQRIVDGFWKPGDRLPSENDLAELFGVSRVSIRSALQTLSTLNFIETRNGGTYVREFDFSIIIDEVSEALAKSVSEDEINKFRSLIEPEVIRLIAARELSEEDLAPLEDCCRRMEGAIPAFDMETFSEQDYLFHLYLSKLCGNKMFFYSYMMMEAILKQYFRSHFNQAHFDKVGIVYEQRSDYWNMILKMHRDIISYLRTGEFESVIAIVQSFSEDEVE